MSRTPLVLLMGLACSGPKPPTAPPRFLAPRAQGEGAIAIDATDVYWIDRGTSVPDPSRRDGKVNRIPRQGGASKVLAEKLSWPRGLAIDDSSLYWAGFAEGKIFKLAKEGGTPVAIASDQNTPRDVAVDATHVYFLAAPGEVRRVPKAGGAVEVLATGLERPTRIGVDGSHVFWMGSTVGRCAKDGSGVVVLARGIRQPGAFALDDAWVYWIDRAEGWVQRVPKDGGEARTLAKQQWDALEMTVDGDWIYWQAGERILKMRKEGGAPALWTKGAYTVGGLATDAHDLYWLEDHGAVKAMPK